METAIGGRYHRPALAAVQQARSWPTSLSQLAGSSGLGTYSPFSTLDSRRKCIYNVIIMKASIITIGNSKGIRIPKPLLEESGLDKAVEIKAKKGEIRITAPPAEPKKKLILNEEYLLSLGALSDWNSPEEDEAWADLQ